MKFKTIEQLVAAQASTADMQRERGAVFARMDYVVRGAESENRQLTADEQREYAALEKVHDGITAHLTSSEEHLRAQRVGVSNGGRTEPGKYRPGQPLAQGQSFREYANSRGLVNEDQEDLSAGKYLRGIVTGEWRGAEKELKAALSEGTSTAGGHLVPTPLSTRIIDRARNRTRVLQAGAQTVPMETSTLKVARLATDPTAAWHTENATITASDPAFEAVTLTARTLAGLTTMSMELLEDADVDQLVENAFADVFALKLDLAALYGSGTPPEPLGVKNTTGVTTTSMGTNGGYMTADDYVDAVTAPWLSNFEPTGVITSVRTARSLLKLKDGDGNYLDLPQSIKDVPFFSTLQVPTNLTQGSSSTAGDLFVADWREMIVGVRHQFSIKVLSERYADTGSVGILAWFRADIALARPAAFHVVSGITN